MRRLIFLIVFCVLLPSICEARTYTTSFPLTENPISESGNWINGLATGLDWANVATQTNLAYGIQVTGTGPNYHDATALLTGTWGVNQTITATVYVGSPTVSDYPEIELRLHSSLSAHTCDGYEIIWSVGNSYMGIVRWNGSEGNFTDIGTYTYPGTDSRNNVANGDIISATIDASGNIKAFKNGILYATATDTTYATGARAPGMGFDYNSTTGGNQFGLSSFSASDATPVLYFSDLTSGPATGLGDGKGSGAIVTVWGVNLGTPTLTSGQPASGYSVAVNGTTAAYVYEWANATQHTGHPADLYTYHKMQTIAFSLGAGTTSGNIVVTTPAGQSSTLPFTVRSGSIYHVKSAANGGSDSNPGTWASPWLTINHSLVNQVAGTTVYVGSGVDPNNNINKSGNTDATKASPIAVIAYPGASVTVTSTSYGCVWVDGLHYFTASKLALHGNSPCVHSFSGMRVVGSECTDAPGECPTAQIGSMGDGSVADGTEPHSDMVFLGNYIHDLGSQCSTTWDLGHHTFYLANRTRIKADHGMEVGLNHLYNNKTCAGIHFYDEHGCGDWGTPNLVHDNVVENQYGPGIDYTFTCSQGSVLGTPTIAVGGSGYHNGDFLMITAGCSYNPQVCVTGVDGNGAITSVTLCNGSGLASTTAGEGCSTGSNLSVTGGNGSGAKFNIASVGPDTVTAPLYEYNNLLIHPGLSCSNCWSGASGYPEIGIGVSGATNLSTAYIYNNTIYGWGNVTPGNGGSGGGLGISQGGNAGTFGGTIYFRNNIFIDTLGLGYEVSSGNGGGSAPAYHSNNLWYSTGGSESPPSWDTSPLNVDPKFNNASAGDFSLQGTSPALGAGYNLTGTYPLDILGATRPVPQSIGAFDSGTGGGSGDSTPPTVTISTGSPQAISSDSLVIAGTASDDVGVSSCKYRIGSAPDATHGVACTGTTSWSCSTSGYSLGANTAYVGCGDAAGNWGSSSITVNYTPGSSSGPFSSGTGPVPMHAGAVW